MEGKGKEGGVCEGKGGEGDVCVGKGGEGGECQDRGSERVPRQGQCWHLHTKNINANGLPGTKRNTDETHWYSMHE